MNSGAGKKRPSYSHCLIAHSHLLSMDKLLCGSKIRTDGHSIAHNSRRNTILTPVDTRVVISLDSLHYLELWAAVGNTGSIVKCVA